TTAGAAQAEKKYGPGVTDSSIKIGQTMPYSGPASAYGVVGKAEVAYMAMVNEQGGVNGRKIDLLSLDDGYSPPKTVEQTRRLVEQEEVLMIYQSLGTPTNTAIQKYLNAKKVPHIFLATGAAKWGEPKTFPWTMGFNPTYQIEARIYAQHILKTRPDAKIAVIYQNDDFGKDYIVGFKGMLGDKAAKMIVAEQTYEVTDPTVDSQVVSLKSSGADMLLTFATPKFAAQVIRKVGELGWKPVHYLTNVSASVSAVLQPAGLDKATGIISATYFKDPTDPQWKNDPAVKTWEAWMKKYHPSGSLEDGLNVYGYIAGQALVHLLKACGDDLSRENIMRQAANLKKVELALLLPGVTLNTSPADFYPIGEMQLAKFDGKRWVLFGEILSGR
ncbi:MAG: ABC transporter substrate-binding protein, partial [Betaproteobacteria bacterium]|nr:ABC transporter substrate-binding protein [Betaproteobacteria bacterium]